MAYIEFYQIGFAGKTLLLNTSCDDIPRVGECVNFINISGTYKVKNITHVLERSNIKPFVVVIDVEKIDQPIIQETVDPIRYAFRHADKLDWEKLFCMLPDSGYGSFWKEVLSRVRTALEEQSHDK